MKRILYGLNLGLIVCFIWAAGAFAAEKSFASFTDVAAAIGITLMNICGGAAKDFILEANGNGAAFFDYNNDGNVDVLIVNGSTMDHYKAGGDPLVALYKNDGGGLYGGNPRARAAAKSRGG